MNRRDLIRASAALNIIGWRASHAGGAPAGDAYIDASAAGTGHSGTFADPYSTADALIYFSLLSGDLNNRNIRFKAGTTFVGRLSITGCDNYVIEPYGSGPLPLISNHVDISSLTWRADDGVRGGPTAGVWFIPVSGGGGSTWSAGETAVSIHDGASFRQCEARASYADLAGALYQCCDDGYSTYPFLQWWDTTSSPNRMWIRVPAGLDPNAAPVVRPVSNQLTVNLQNGEGAIMRDIAIAHGAVTNFYSNMSGLTLERLDCYNAGGEIGFSQDVYNFTGNSKVDRATDLVMRSCIARRSRARLSSHGLEIGWLDNFTIDDFLVQDVRLHGIEFWQSCSNGLIRRMKVRQTMTMMQFQPGEADEADTLHDHMTIVNGECVQRATYENHGASGDHAGGHGIVTSDFSRNRKFVSDIKIYNNSFDLDDAVALFSYVDVSAGAGLGDNSVTFKNNLVRLSQLTSTGYWAVYAGAVSSAADDWTMNRNVYQFGVQRRWSIAGDQYSTLAAYLQAWDSNGQAPNEDNSVSPDAGAVLCTLGGGTAKTTSLSLMNQVVAAVGLADTADANTPATDILDVARDSAPDAGAYEYVAGSDSTPAPVDFQDQTNVGINLDITSAAITITGLTTGATVSVFNGSYQIGGSGSFVTSTGTIYNGQTLRARVHSSSLAGAPATVTVTVGGTPITFTATTGAGGGAGPDQFAFTEFTGADYLATFISMPVTLTGLTGPASISVTGVAASAMYSVNSTTVFTTVPGTVVNGDVIRAAVTTGSAGGTPYDAVVTINGVVGTFRVTTGEPP